MNSNGTYRDCNSLETTTQMKRQLTFKQGKGKVSMNALAN